ncbi:hypothetical protein [Magnetospirillum sulfuroxidans]|uniref:Uncharacterized protein n=1 Tax=Magnetospirillum sulfuroxidans TaxID=611300 RepID=A0ABS5IEA8_9PROT|nr:hypothetical protein [Magnetospirillum sulfuroxidans]MBR9972757.1 hypothetical protein [Magnetospirillum sulfuroxidans]
MSVSAAASSGYTDPNQFAPVFASENATTAATQKQQDAKHLTLFGEGDDEPSFWDLLDVINPLQHIPVVNTLYQELTGDKIGVGARLAGGALFGGPIGLVASAIGCIVEEETGDDIGGHVMALFKDDAASDSAVASETPASPSPDTPATAQAVTTDKPKQMAAIAPQEESALPAIPMPETPTPTAATAAAAATPAAMMFSADGLVTPQTAAATAPAVTTPVVASIKPMPLNTASAPRFMAPPSRTISAAEQAPPPVTVPVSGGSSRSNVPVTGRSPLTGHTPDPIAVQKAMAQQGLTPGTQHPMLPSANPAGGSSDWLQSMNTALDKYQKAGNLAARAENPATIQTLQ